LFHFLIQVFLPTSLVGLPFDFRMLPAWHRLLRAHMLLRSLVRHIVLSHMHPADSLHFCYAIVLAVTRHGSCIGGVLHPGISDSWFFRRQQCRRNWSRSQYVLTISRHVNLHVRYIGVGDGIGRVWGLKNVQGQPDFFQRRNGYALLRFGYFNFT
jgi:hypothetical protein